MFLILLALFFTVNAFLHYNFSYTYVIVNDYLNYNLFRFIAAVFHSYLLLRYLKKREMTA